MEYLIVYVDIYALFMWLTIAMTIILPFMGELVSFWRCLIDYGVRMILICRSTALKSVHVRSLCTLPNSLFIVIVPFDAEWYESLNTVTVNTLYAFFWVIPRRLNFICRRFVTHSVPSCSIHTYPSMKMEQSVPKRRHIKFRHRGITQKKA